MCILNRFQIQKNGWLARNFGSYYYNTPIFNCELKSISAHRPVHRIDCYNYIFSIAEISHVLVNRYVTSDHADHAVSNE